MNMQNLESMFKELLIESEKEYLLVLTDNVFTLKEPHSIKENVQVAVINSDRFYELHRFITDYVNDIEPVCVCEDLKQLYKEMRS